MPGRKKRTSRLLILLTILMCIASGGVLTQSAAEFSAGPEEEVPALLAAGENDDSAFTSGGTAAAEEFQDADEPGSPEEDPSVTDVPAVTPEPTATPVPAPVFEASPEAARGTWVSSGSSWLFMVDGAAYTGWLTDTDGKRYYFGSDGIMQTGWLEDGQGRYYLDLDGIMQKGDVIVDGVEYHLREDGCLDGYAPETTATPAPAAAQEPADVTEETPAADRPEPEESPAPEAAVSPAAQGQESAPASAGVTPAPQAGTELPGVGKTVALTFDDGPSEYTDRLLDCLEANGVKATFFLVGQEIYNFPEAVQRMASLGCEIGNHSYTHADANDLIGEDIAAEIEGTDANIRELTGQIATVYRPPYGNITDDVTANAGKPVILWSIDTLDWETLNAQQTVDTIMAEITDGSIVLMHDLYESSVEAAETLIPELIKEGYTLATVHELAAAHNMELQDGVAYTSIP